MRQIVDLTVSSPPNAMHSKVRTRCVRRPQKSKIFEGRTKPNGFVAPKHEVFEVEGIHRIPEPQKY